MADYDVLQFSDFDSYYEDVLKKYRHSFQDDFQAVRQTIVNKLEDWNVEPRQVTGDTERIPMGDGFRFRALKTRIMIKEAQSKIGRLIWICDEERENIFLTDVYHKNDRTNHSEEIIAEAHNEYFEEYCEDS